MTLPKITRIVTSIYLLFVLYIVFYSQARCSAGKFTPPPNAPKPLTSVDVVAKNKLPANWSEPDKPAESYRIALMRSTANLVTLPAEVPEGLKQLKRLEAQESVAPVDPLLLVFTTQAVLAHDRANYKVRRTAMRAGGVPLYTSNRGSSSGSYSSHK